MINLESEQITAYRITGTAECGKCGDVFFYEDDFDLPESTALLRARVDFIGILRDNHWIQDGDNWTCNNCIDK